MKKLLLAFSLLATVFIAKAQSETTDPNAPVIKWETTTIDYGEVEYGSNGEREFFFTNIGKTPLIISNAQGSCGCTVPSWPKEPIMPGQKASIKVKYDTNRPGTISKSVTITSNAASGSDVIYIKGFVKNQPESSGQ